MTQLIRLLLAHLIRFRYIAEYLYSNNISYESIPRSTTQFYENPIKICIEPRNREIDGELLDLIYKIGRIVKIQTGVRYIPSGYAIGINGFKQLDTTEKTFYIIYIHIPDTYGEQ